MFSVVIPLYNKELSVKSTVQSVLNQSFSDFEIVIVNDGSTDNSVEVVEGFDDPRIRIIHQKNQGVSAARNRGIKEAKYEWIAFLDADDLWKENHLKVLKGAITKYPEDKVFCTSYIKSNENFSSVNHNSIQIIENYFSEAIKRHFFWTSVTCIHISVFNKIGVFKEFLNRGEDLDLWARIGRKYRFIKSNLTTAIYVIETENKLTEYKSVYSKSILSLINLKTVKEEERKYYKKMILVRIKNNIRVGDFKELMHLLKKHNLELLK